MVSKTRVAGISIFHPAHPGLPVPVRPREGKDEVRRSLLLMDLKVNKSVRNMSSVRAGSLWLHGFIDDAHKIAQDDTSVEGSYWHALVHRSEGDFDNSLYWFGRVGRHPIFPELRARLVALAGDFTKGGSAETLRAILSVRKWEPERFVELCRAAHASRVTSIDFLQRISAEEYDLLMAYCLGSEISVEE